GIEAYEAAGGIVLRDLFQGDGDGWLQDVVLVDRLVAERLAREADAIRAEGWHWLEVAPDFPYGHSFGLRRLRGEEVPLTAAEAAEQAALQAEYERLEAAHAQDESMPDEVDRRLTEIETRLAALEERPVRFDPAEIARAGAFVSIDGDGELRVERGYVRPEDERPVAPDPDPAIEGEEDAAASAAAMPMRIESDDASDDERIQAGPDTAEPEEEDGIK